MWVSFAAASHKRQAENDQRGADLESLVQTKIEADTDGVWGFAPRLLAIPNHGDLASTEIGNYRIGSLRRDNYLKI